MNALRRIATAAQKLGIRNIYSIYDRYQADQRWFYLHSKAVEAY